MLQGLPGPKGQKGDTVGLDKVCKDMNYPLNLQLYNIIFYGIYR